MKKCTVCGKPLNMNKSKRYEIRKTPQGLTALTESPRVYEAFDCDHCGCQNIVNIREVGE